MAIFLSSYLAGLVSFVAPCLLPLLPSYFSAISGATFQELYGLNDRNIRLRLIGNSLLFVGGFSLFFTLLGATGSAVGIMLQDQLNVLLRIGGIVMIFFGLSQLGIMQVSFMKFDYAWQIQRRLTHLGFITSIATGIVAAISWVPCISATLTPILLLASSKSTVLEGSLLLFIFSLGLGTPFVAAGFIFPILFNFIQKHRKFLHALSLFAGAVMIVFGLLLFTEQYNTYILFIRSLVRLMKQ